MSVTATYRSHLSVVETLEGPFVDPSDATVGVNGLDTTASLSGSTTPPVTKESAFEISLTAGAATIDLTSLPGLDGQAGAVDGTGLKVQIFKIKGKAGNANVITATAGASNGYDLKGSGWSAGVLAGQEDTFYGNDATPDIAAGAKDIDLAGTDEQTLQVHIVMG